MAKIRALNRLMCVAEAMRFALNSLAVVAPEWLVQYSEVEWVERYGHRIEESRLPTSQAQRQALAEEIGEDGRKVPTAVFDPLAPAWLQELPAIQVLRRIWLQNYDSEDGHLRWREAQDLPPAWLFLNSPYDPQARLGKKRSSLWTGYKVHRLCAFQHHIAAANPDGQATGAAYSAPGRPEDPTHHNLATAVCAACWH